MVWAAAGDWKVAVVAAVLLALVWVPCPGPCSSVCASCCARAFTACGVAAPIEGAACKEERQGAYIKCGGPVRGIARPATAIMPVPMPPQ